MKTSLATIIFCTTLCACGHNKHEADAYGNFEAVETIVGAESMGKLLVFDVEEGMKLPADTIIGWIDSTQLHLKKTQLQANINAVLSKRPDTQAQLQVIQEQIARQQIEQRRISNLLKAQAATPKQLDDVNAQIAVLQQQYHSLAASLQTQVNSYNSETKPLAAQVAQVADQLKQSRIVNPVKGTVLVKYVEKGEVVTYGKALYKIADLSTMVLRAYIIEPQLGQVKIGQPVTVLTDTPDGKYREWTGSISWIADEAEFTPKIIQTKEERTNLVYAIKVKVINDGSLKIGMPATLLFSKK